jgi:O-antigen/teichoic acid export membrane protein
MSRGVPDRNESLIPDTGEAPERTPASARPVNAARNTAWNFADLIVGAVLGMLASVLVARALGPTILGQYQFVVWMASIIATLSMYGVPVSANRNLAAYLVTGERGYAGALIRRTLKIQAAIGSIVFVAGLALVFGLLPPAQRLFGVVAFMSVVPTLLMAVPTGLNALDDNYRGNALPSLVDGVVACAGVGVVIWAHLGLVGLAAATLLARLLDCGLRFWMARERIGSLLRMATHLPVRESAQFNRMAREAALMQLLAFVVWNRSEIFFLKLFSGPEQIAFFSLAFGLALKPGLLSATAARVFDPAILRSYHVSERSAVEVAAQSVRLQAFMSYPMFFALGIIAAPAIAVLYTQRYVGAISLAVVLVFATAMQSGRTALETLLRAADRQRQMVGVYLGVSLLTLAVDWILIQRFAGIGAAIANGAIQIIQAIWVMLLAMRYTSLRWSDLALGKPLLIAAMSAATSWLVTQGWSPVAALIVRPLLLAAQFGAGLWILARLGYFTAEERGIFRSFWSRARRAVRSFLRTEPRPELET